MQRFFAPLALLAAAVSAQTYTNCNPLNATCPSDPALGTTYSDTFNSSTGQFNSKLWNVTAGSSLTTFSDASGAALTLASDTDSVTVQSTFYIFFGRVEMMMRAAPGTGIISTMLLLSDDLDEIDWEIMGGNSTHVENNYYGWGNTSQINSQYPALQGAQAELHNYTLDWSQERVQWILDGNVVREVPYAAPGMYPQTPCRVQFGAWCGGCSDQPGTVQWAGGKADFSKGPFSMYVQSIRVIDAANNASSYTYSDHSGNFASIHTALGQSEAYNAINDSLAHNVSQRWTGLSRGAQIGIAAGVLGTLAVAMVAFGFYCARQRKAGRAEAARHEKEWQSQNEELMEYRSMMAKGNFAVSRQSILMDAKATSGGRKF